MSPTAQGTPASRDTIFALSSAPGRAAVAVVRLSGPAAAEILKGLVAAVPGPREARLRRLCDPRSGDTLDRALVLWLPGPKTFTGEDMAELHLHGGRATVAGVLHALGARGRARPAEPGEFARRAFEAGRMDLAGAEALADLIDAETDAQRRLALRGLDGGIGARAEAWSARLVEALALAEAEIDFPDEGDVPPDLARQGRRIAAELAREIAAALDDKGRGERLRAGAVVVIAGPPNVGKSTFLNRVAEREVAIVSPHAGTTRDVLEVALDLGGYPVTLVDTAGLRASADPVEQEGVRRTRARVASADLVLFFADPEHIDAEPEAIPSGAPVWRVLNKADLLADEPRTEGAAASRMISALHGAGIEELLTDLRDWLHQELEPGPEPLITRARHRHALQDALIALGRAQGWQPGGSVELLAEDLRLAGRALGRISGRVDVDDVLDAVFGQFCIGK